MVVVAKRLPFESLVRTAEQLSAGVDLPTVLELLAAAAAEATGAEIAIVRVLDEASGLLVAGRSHRAGRRRRRSSPARASPRVDPARLVRRPGLRRRERRSARSSSSAPATAPTRPPAGSPSSRRRSSPSPLRTLPRPESLRPSTADRGARLALLEREGRTLAAGAELERAARRAMQLAAETVGAAAAAIWQRVDERLELLAHVGAWTPPAPRAGAPRGRAHDRSVGARARRGRRRRRRRARVDPDRATARRRPAAPLHRAAGRGGARRPLDVRRTRGRMP